MTKDELLDLALRYEAKAEKAQQKYQETGIGRYDWEYRNNDDLASALRIAAAAKEDHDRLISIRCDLAPLVVRAKEATPGDKIVPPLARRVLRDFISWCEINGIITEMGK